MLEGFPIINGTQVLRPPPEGYVVDFENPTRQYVLEHYFIFGIMGTLAFIALLQRFYVKMFLSKGLQIDDGFMLLAWLSSTVVQAMMVHTVVIKGLGCHTWEIPLEHYRSTLVISYVAAGLFMLCNGFTKLSLLTFYLGLSPQQWWRIAVWISITVVALYTIIITTMLYVHCTPVNKAFDFTIQEGSCINVGILYIATAVSNIITDILLFVLPIPMIVRLKMGVFQKVGAIVIFGIGSMTVTTSVVRLVYLFTVLTSDDTAWDAARANVWSMIEANLFIICGSMPTIRKFFKHFAPRLMGVSSSDPSYGPKYGGANYAGGYAPNTKGGATVPYSRKQRSQYENFDDDNELAVFDSAGREGDAKRAQASETLVDGGGEPQPDNGSEKAILQTKTFTVRYD